MAKVSLRPFDRRGPLRPKRLAPSRARLRGRAVARMIQVADALAMVALSAAMHRSFAPVAGQAQMLVGPLVVVALLATFKLYDFPRDGRLAPRLGKLLLATATAAILTVALFTPQAAGTALGLAWKSWAPTALAVLTGLHVLWWLSVRRWRETGLLTPNIVVVGATSAAERLIVQALERRDANVLGVFDDRGARAPAAIAGVPVLGDTRALLDHRILPFVDRIVIAVPARAQARVRQVIERLRGLPNEIVLVLDGRPPGEAAEALARAADVPLAHVCGPPRDEARAMIKRGLDLAVGLTALVFLAPVILGLALAVRLDSPGPVFFRQRRHGFNNEEIVVWKFRSMRADAADATASRQVEADDARVTRLGRLMRRTSLDELPQIFNVLKGEMSLVGPRPHAIGMRTGEVESARLVAEYAHRHRMKPGVTGWAAIRGSRGPVDTPEAVRRRVALDIEYIERQSFWLDLYILIMTLPCLIGDREAVR